LHAKAGTHKADATALRGTQQQPGRKRARTTAICLRARAGEKVTGIK